MIRATTTGALRSYRSNLSNSFINLNNARETVLSPRTFQSYGDDPAAASQAFQLRRSYLHTCSQITVSSSVVHKYETAYSSLESVVNMVDNRTENSSWVTVLEALNDPTGDARTALGKELNQLADSIVQAMNTKYGDAFTFAGADGLNVPFTWETDADGNKQLYYRGVSVDAAVPNVVMNSDGSQIKVDENGRYDASGEYYLLSENTSTISRDDYDALVAEWQQYQQDLTDYNNQLAADPNYSGPRPSEPETPVPDVLTERDGSAHTMTNTEGTPYYIVLEGGPETVSKEDYEQAEEDVAKLEFMSKETNYVDIGIGFQEDANDHLIDSSGFDMCMQGIQFLGYGKDEDGDPKNIVSLLREMANICYGYHDGEWNEESGDYQDLHRLAGKLEDAADQLRLMHTDMTAEAAFLKDNQEQLESAKYTLNEQIGDLEDVDMADAITSFSWAQYCYNAALKVGNSILSQSLMDYLS